MARPRTHADETLLDLVAAGSYANGGAWTLKDAAREAGVHPATLVKRFGSRHGLLLALSRRWVDSRPTNPLSDDPYGELLDWIRASASVLPTSGQARAQIAMLVEDINDGQLRALLNEGWRREIDYLAQLLEQIAAIGTFAHAPAPAQGAALIFDYLNGTHLRAATAPEDERLNDDPAATVALVLKSWG